MRPGGARQLLRAVRRRAVLDAPGARQGKGAGDQLAPLQPGSGDDLGGWGPGGKARRGDARGFRTHPARRSLGRRAADGAERRGGTTPTGPAPVEEGTKLSAEEKADREAATVWVSGLDKINAACGIGVCVDLSATPFYIQGSGYPEGSPFPWIVSDFSLVDAIEAGITKIPRPAGARQHRTPPIRSTSGCGSTSRGAFGRGIGCREGSRSREVGLSRGGRRPDHSGERVRRNASSSCGTGEPGQGPDAAGDDRRLRQHGHRQAFPPDGFG